MRWFYRLDLYGICGGVSLWTNLDDQSKWVTTEESRSIMEPNLTYPLLLVDVLNSKKQGQNKRCK